MAEGLDFLIPSLLFMKGALIDNQRSSNKFAASGNRSALRLPGAFRRRGFQPDHFMEISLCGWAHSPRGTSCRPAHAAGGTLTQRAFLQILYLQEINAGYGRKGEGELAIFHFTVKIVGRSKGKSIIAASAYLNGDVMKNEETGKVSYYTSKKEVVYTSLMMCENAPPEWTNVPDENIKRFQKSIRYQRAEDKEAALEKFKITF